MMGEWVSWYCPGHCPQPLTTSLALFFTIRPSLSHFLTNTHLLVSICSSGGFGTNSQVPFSWCCSSSARIELSHSGHLGDSCASLRLWNLSSISTSSTSAIRASSSSSCLTSSSLLENGS